MQADSCSAQHPPLDQRLKRGRLDGYLLRMALDTGPLRDNLHMAIALLLIMPCHDT